MPKVQSTTKNLAAGVLVEVILSISIIAMLALGLLSGISYSLQGTRHAINKNRATSLASEGMEAVANIREASFASLVNGNFGLQVSANKWQLSGTSDSANGYTRQIQISTVDSNTKQVTVTVSWTQTPGGQVQLTQYLTDWHRLVTLNNWLSIATPVIFNLNGNQDPLKLDFTSTHAFILRNQNNTDNLAIVDITTPASPSLVFEFDLNASPDDIAMFGNYAVMASTSNSQELQIVNATNPAAPTLASSINLAGNTDALSIAVTGNTAVLGEAASGNPEFFTFDITNPASPTQIGSLEIGNNVNDIVISGNTAFISTNSTTAEIRAINITSPATPTSLGTFNLPTTGCTANQLAYFNNILYVGCGNNTLYALNVTLPAAITQVGTYNAGGAINAVSLDTTQNLLFLTSANATQEVQVVDIALPATMTLRSSFNSSVTLVSSKYNTSQGKLYALSSDNAQELFIFSSN